MSQVRFGSFDLDLANGDLRKADRTIRLQPQTLKVLQLPANRPGQLVSRDEIQKHIWADETVVDFNQGPNYFVRQIRAALCDNAELPLGSNPRFQLVRD